MNGYKKLSANLRGFGNNLDLSGELYELKGKFPEAEITYRGQFSAMQSEHGPYHPDTLATLHKLASVLARQGKYQQAELLWWDACQAIQGTKDLKLQYYLNVVKGLAAMYDAWGKPEQAAQWRKKLPPASGKPGARPAQKMWPF